MFYRFSPELATALTAAMAREGLDTYDITFGCDQELSAAIEAAINQGIDSHLEAIQFDTFTQTRSLYDSGAVSIEAQSLPTLIRRLAEPLSQHWEERDATQDYTLGESMMRLAGEICSTLNIEADFC